MREIKFRAWDTVLGRLIKWGDVVQADPRLSDWLGQERYIWLQYTGLRDKQGVEIYEGDVLKALNGHLFEIVWYKGLACFDARSIRCHDEMMSVGWPLAEVIGNVYQNPELVK